MKTFFNKKDRYFVAEFPLTGEPIGEGTGYPTLKLRVSHYKFAKALIANVTYVEKDKGAGYSIEKWQSDWPLIRVATKPTARYSEKALREFADEALATLIAGGYDNDTVTALLARIAPEEQAA